MATGSGTHVTKAFGIRSAYVTKMLTDLSGAPATYAGFDSAVVASPTPTTTGFSVTAASGSGFTVGKAVYVGTASGAGNVNIIDPTIPISVITAISTDAITVSPALPAAPSTGVHVFQPLSYRIPGAKTLTSTSTVKSVDLRGDNTFLDSDAVFQSLEFAITNAKHSLDVLSVILGGTVTDTGTTGQTPPIGQTIWALTNPPSFNLVRIEAQCFSSDLVGGDFHICINKARASDAPLPGFADEDYSYPAWKFKGIPPIGTTPWVQYVLNEGARVVAAA